MNSVKRQVRVIVEGKEYLVEVGDLNARPITATVNQRSYQVQVGGEGAPTSAPKPVPQPSVPVQAVPPAKPAAPPALADLGGNAIVAPMPGDIIEVFVKAGDQVTVGQELCMLEAMKMKNAIRSPRDGVVASVPVSPGQSVDYGEVLVTFE